MLFWVWGWYKDINIYTYKTILLDRFKQKGSIFFYTFFLKCYNFKCYAIRSDIQTRYTNRLIDQPYSNVITIDVISSNNT